MTQRRNDPVNRTHSLNPIPRLLVAGLIVLVIAIADEIHQSLIPTREASITDVLLDTIGISLVILLTIQLYKRQKLLMVRRKVRHLLKPMWRKYWSLLVAILLAILTACYLIPSLIRFFSGED